MISQSSFITSVCVLCLLLAKIYTYDTKDTLQQNENSQHVLNNLSNGRILLQIPQFFKTQLKVSEPINNYNSSNQQQQQQQLVKNPTENVTLNYKSRNYHSNTSSLHELNKFQFKTKVQVPLDAKYNLISAENYNSTTVLFRLNAPENATEDFNSQTNQIEREKRVKQQKSNFAVSREPHKDFNHQTQVAYDFIRNARDKVQLMCSLATKHLQRAFLENSTGSRQPRKKKTRFRKIFKKLLLPLLLAYKLKFLTLIPLLIGGLVLLVGTTGLAGFFFALFAAVMTLKIAGSTHHDVMVKGKSLL